MSSLRQVARTSPSVALRTPSSLAASPYGRSPAYRRLLSSLERQHQSQNGATSILASQALLSSTPKTLRSPFLPQTIAAVQLRSLHQSPRWLQEQPQQAAHKAEPKTEEKADQKPSDAESEAKTESEEQQKKEEDGEKKQEKKEDLPPPPPHGDKTPWQVFMETMQSEFKQSKEWNDSTKQLAAGAKEFSESEGVRRAREAYESTTGAISSTTGKVLKNTGSAIGKGAAWTWETPVMKGVRKGANITGDALDRATKPIRETDAYKNVKNVIDDGSSSRYGGWVEKEERRKAREMRKTNSPHGNPEDMVEDPEYVHLPFHPTGLNCY
jgi:mitochondrial import inner membrane translocase subunit TIM44